MLIGWYPRTEMENHGSTRLRALKPLSWINDHHALGDQTRLSVFRPGGVNLYNGVILSKAFIGIAQEVVRVVKERGGFIIFDICDNYIAMEQDGADTDDYWSQLLYIFHASNAIVFSTISLRDAYGPWLPKAVPTYVIADPIEDFAGNRNERGREASLRLLWFGNWGVDFAQGGLSDLRRLLPALSSLAAKGVSVELRVVSNNYEQYARICSDFPIATSYAEWELESFGSELAATDLVVLPITVNEFTKHKSNNRMAIPLVHGVPVLADRIPAYEEYPAFLIRDGWESDLPRALERLDHLRSEAAAAGRSARETYGIDRIAGIWAQTIQETLAAHGQSGLR